LEVLEQFGDVNVCSYNSGCEGEDVEFPARQVKEENKLYFGVRTVQ
jgi:hypothetical protein